MLGLFFLVLSWRNGWLCCLKDPCLGPKPDTCSHHCLSPIMVSASLCRADPAEQGRSCSVIAAPFMVKFRGWRDGRNSCTLFHFPLFFWFFSQERKPVGGALGRVCTAPISERQGKEPENPMLHLHLLLWLKAWALVSGRPQTCAGIWMNTALLTDFLTLGK